MIKQLRFTFSVGDTTAWIVYNRKKKNSGPGDPYRSGIECLAIEHLRCDHARGQRWWRFTIGTEQDE